MAEEVLLRDMSEDDLPTFYEHQLDAVATHMAAFTAKDSGDKAGFMQRWGAILGDDNIAKKTILVDGNVAGHVVSFERSGKPEVMYWIGREHWGRGLATKALSEFLVGVEKRPLYARAARDNIASIRVLEKCGFKITGYEKAFAEARGREIEEIIMTLK